MIFLALIINASGFLGLAAASARYRDALLGRGRNLRFPRTSQCLAASLIGISWLLAGFSTSLASGLVIFVGLSTIGAAISVFCITVGRALRSH
ncbi:DUF3325 family protein [Sphingomonas sp. CL5.1]|uniref:DUF3325 family protein n=1 Tax=Sphingomonas sp. CL5.1 TaxID=2653203 RepID=UPI00158179E4|nr:DUF3325 family protein [Sphingomonas sp. CL5.1]QKR98374.1 DUF3325 family protein [Sphingomonas sp. CL5.1]